MPLAVPLMDSSGASVLKTTVLTPLGSLKLKLMGAAISRLPEPNRTARGAILLWKAICGYDSRPGDAVSSQFIRRSVRVPSGGQGLTDGGGPSSAQQKAPPLRTGGARNDGVGMASNAYLAAGVFRRPSPAFAIRSLSSAVIALRSSAESLPSLSLSYFSVISFCRAFCSSVIGCRFLVSGFLSSSAALAVRVRAPHNPRARINPRNITCLSIVCSFLFVCRCRQLPDAPGARLVTADSHA